jgi:Inner membrane protein YgaP-like, transmembrane domain
MMSHNVGRIGRAIRLAIGTAFLAAAFFRVLEGASGIATGVAGAIAVISALIGFCPVWAVLGINTSGTTYVTSACADWRFQHFHKKQLDILAKHLACRAEALMDTYDEGVPVGTAYGENLAKRLRFLYHWTPDQIEQTLSRLKGAR